MGFCVAGNIDNNSNNNITNINTFTIFMAAVKMCNSLNIVKTGRLQMRTTNCLNICKFDLLDGPKQDSHFFSDSWHAVFA